MGEQLHRKLCNWMFNLTPLKGGKAAIVSLCCRSVSEQGGLGAEERLENWGLDIALRGVVQYSAERNETDLEMSELELGRVEFDEGRAYRRTTDLIRVWEAPKDLAEFFSGIMAKRQGILAERQRIRGELLRLRQRFEDVEIRGRMALFEVEIDRICPE